MPDTPRADIYERITSQIVAAIEAGTETCKMPWHHDGGAITRPSNAASGNQYRGVNILSLWSSAKASGFSSGVWGTYKQWKQAGAQVKKGARGTPIVFYREVQSNEAAEGHDEPSTYLVARGFTVFNVDQVEGFEVPPAENLPEEERIASADVFFSNLRIPTKFGGSSTFYVPATDTVHLPDFSAFKDAASFYGVLAHECAHASGSKDRINRNLSGRFGDDAYAAEELVAEFSASFVLADLGIAAEPRPDHASYIEHWLKVLKSDPKALFAGASKAQQVADWMHEKQREVSCQRRKNKPLRGFGVERPP